jgi:hypothetical protein
MDIPNNTWVESLVEHYFDDVDHLYDKSRIDDSIREGDRILVKSAHEFDVNSQTTIYNIYFPKWNRHTTGILTLDSNDDTLALPVKLVEEAAS